MDIKGFAGALTANGLAASTIVAYSREVRRFQRFLRQRHLRVTQATPRLVTEYIQGPGGEKKPQPASTRRRLAALSAFFDYRRQMSDGRTRNPVEIVRRPKRQPPNPRPVEDRVLEALLAGVTRPRDTAILMLLANSGLRLAEVTSLDRDSIEIEVTPLGRGVERVLGVGRVVGKGNKEREFLVDMKTMAQVHAYLETRADREPALFLSNRRRRLSPRALESMLVRWCRRLGLPPTHPHACRHFFSTRANALGMGLLEISKLLGHSSVAVTQQYIRPDRQKVRAEYFAALEAVSPGSCRLARRPPLPGAEAHPARGLLPAVGPRPALPPLDRPAPQRKIAGRAGRVAKPSLTGRGKPSPAISTVAKVKNQNLKEDQ